MLRWMIRCVRLALIMTGFLFSLPVPAAAQTPAYSIETVKVDLWPEYDRPNLLVMYHIVLPAGTTLPVDMAIKIPAAVGNPYNVAKKDSSGLFILDYQRIVQGDWAIIQLKAETLETQIEYYDPALVKQGSSRSFTFEWQGDYALNSFSIEVQQPIGVTQLTINPTMGSSNSGQDGLTYYFSALGKKAFGEKVKVAVQYTKSTDELSGRINVEPSTPITTQTPGRTPGLNTILVPVLAVLGLVLIGGGGYWYWRTGRPGQGGASSGSGRKRHLRSAAKRSAEEPAAASGADDATYCHQCGRRAGMDDVFCRACGTKLRN